ncbi:MAG: mannose-6-phosphate isomerase, class I, partial [Phyllobacteriaceae bacterium]|nr:mannose-6-phosphate isomerase, class I [Phyllobacteriaceae bacterium]
MVPGAHPLEGRLRSYPWGGDRFLRDLTGEGGDGPAAEWWLGAHPDAPSLVRLPGGDAPLDAVVAAAPVAVLGPAVAARFGRLPFLLKVLD